MDGATINIVTNNTGKMLGSVTQETLNPQEQLRKLKDGGTAKVIDMNVLTDFPINGQRKKNKNDFYRFLLQQNFGNEQDEVDQNMVTVHGKFNNDILIPRSILKRNEPVDRKPKKAAEGLDLDELLKHAEDTLPANETLTGKQLEVGGPILSPKNYNQNYLEHQYKQMDLAD